MKYFYFCKQCGEKWYFVPEDYLRYKIPYPSICPHCSMPIFQMLTDIYKEEGILEAIKQLVKRLLKLKKGK